MNEKKKDDATRQMVLLNGAIAVVEGEGLVKRNKYKDREDILQSPWKNVDVRNGTNFIMNGTVMLCLTLSRTSSRLDVLVRDADATITPKQGDDGVEKALRVKMKEKNFKVFKDQVYSLMSKSLTGTQYRLKKKEKQRPWKHNCRLQTRKKKCAEYECIRQKTRRWGKGYHPTLRK